MNSGGADTAREHRWYVIIPLYLVVLATGAAGLMYQVAWQKYLSRLFGSDYGATALVLGVFLGGLSSGYYIFGRLSRKIRNHFKAYALAEVIIGIWGIWFPSLFLLVDVLTQSWTFSPTPLLVLQGLICSTLLMAIPVFCMGATIPLLTRRLSVNLTQATHVHALIYAINTLGAFVGALLAGFYLIPQLGLPATLKIAAYINIGACIFFYILSYWCGIVPAEDSTQSTPPLIPASDNPLLRYGLYAIALLSGFYVMALENVIIRIVNISFGSSSFSFSLTIAAFIVSIAIGSLILSLKRQISWETLFYNQILLTLCLLALYPTLDLWPYFSHLIRIAHQSNDLGLVVYHFHIFMFLLLILIIPIGLSGATVPIIFHLCKRNLTAVGDESGFLFSLNTIGSLLGSLIGGFLLYNLFNSNRVFLFSVLLASVSVIAVAVNISRKYLMAGIALMLTALMLFITIPWYDESRFAIGTFRRREQLSYSMSSPQNFYNQFFYDMTLLSYTDSPSGTVAVVQSTPYVNRLGVPLSIYVNGKSDSNTIFDIDTLKLIAHIPALLAENRQNVMVIGLGTGATVAELTYYPDIENIVVSEVSSAVIDALPLFEDNHQLIKDSGKVHFNIGDAWRMIGRGDHSWDIIISEPSNPWTTGVDSLFTYEFYQRIKQHLSPTGLMVQWAQIYEADISMIDMIVNTLRLHFQEVRTFLTHNSDLVFIASDLPLSMETLEQAEVIIRDNKELGASLHTIGITSIETILIREIWSPVMIKERLSTVGIHTLDHPSLHYIAGKFFFMNSYINPKMLINEQTAHYANDYLLAQRYENWHTYSFPQDQADQVLNSLSHIFYADRKLPMYASVELKQILYRPSSLVSYAERFRNQLRPFIDKIAANYHNWEVINFTTDPFALEVNKILFFLNFSSDWIVPSPLPAAIDLLVQGKTADTKPEDRNYCALWASLLLFNQNPKQAAGIFAELEQGDNGKLLVWPHDRQWFDYAATLFKPQ